MKAAAGAINFRGLICSENNWDNKANFRKTQWHTAFLILISNANLQKEYSHAFKIITKERGCILKNERKIFKASRPLLQDNTENLAISH